MKPHGWRHTAALALTSLLLAITLAGRATAQDGLPVDARIVLAVDVSRSVNSDELALQRDGYAGALRHPDLVAAVNSGPHGRIALAYFEWSGRVRSGSLVSWRVIGAPGDAAGFADAIEALPLHVSHGTSLSRALEFSIALFPDGRTETARHVIDISGDGPNNQGPPVEWLRDRAVARGITINGLPILVDASSTFPAVDRYYEACVIGGGGAFLLTASSKDDLADVIRRKLILEVSGRPPERGFQLAAVEPPVDCLVGEKQRRALVDRFFPGLYQ